MTNRNEIPLYHLFYQFIKLLCNAVRNMPKEYKYTLGQDMVGLAWECLDLTVEANNKPNHEKHRIVNQLSIIFDKLKLRLRLAQEINVISIGQFTHWQTNYLISIGQMLGGWLKWTKNYK